MWRTIICLRLVSIYCQQPLLPTKNTTVLLLSLAKIFLYLAEISTTHQNITQARNDTFISGNEPLIRYEKCGMCMHREWWERLPRHCGFAIPICSGFLWSRRRGKHFRHSRRLRNPQLYEHGRRPIGLLSSGNVISVADNSMWVTGDDITSSPFRYAMY